MSDDLVDISELTELCSEMSKVSTGCPVWTIFTGLGAAFCRECGVLARGASLAICLGVGVLYCLKCSGEGDIKVVEGHNNRVLAGSDRNDQSGAGWTMSFM